MTEVKEIENKIAPRFGPSPQNQGCWELAGCGLITELSFRSNSKFTRGKCLFADGTTVRLGAPAQRPVASDLSRERPISAIAPPERGSEVGLVVGIRAALAGAQVARPPAGSLRAPARCLLRWQRSASAIAISKALRRIATAWPTPCKSRWRSCRRDRSSWCGRIRRVACPRARRCARRNNHAALAAGLRATPPSGIDRKTRVRC